MLLPILLAAACSAAPFFPNAFRDHYPVVPLPDLWSSVDRIDEHVRLNGVASVDDFVKIADPQMRRRPVPMPFTRSEQYASLAEPRIILYHPSGDFFLAYGGRGTTIEMIHLKGARYEFARLDFASGSPVWAAANEIERCYACHAKGARSLAEARMIAHPNFDNYPDWPDAYGNSDLAGSGRATFSPRLQEGWASFQENIASRPRYAELSGLTDLRLVQKLTGDLQEKIGEGLLRRTARLILDHPDHARWLPALGALGTRTEWLFRETLGDAADAYGEYKVRVKPIIESRSKLYHEVKARRFNARSGLVNTERMFRHDYADRTKDDLPGIKDFDAERVFEKVRLGFMLEQMGLSMELLNHTLEPRTYSHTRADGHLTMIDRVIRDERALCASRL